LSFRAEENIERFWTEKEKKKLDLFSVPMIQLKIKKKGNVREDKFFFSTFGKCF